MKNSGFLLFPFALLLLFYEKSGATVYTGVDTMRVEDGFYFAQGIARYPNDFQEDFSLRQNQDNTTWMAGPPSLAGNHNEGYDNAKTRIIPMGLCFLIA